MSFTTRRLDGCKFVGRGFPGLIFCLSTDTLENILWGDSAVSTFWRFGAYRLRNEGNSAGVSILWCILFEWEER